MESGALLARVLLAIVFATAAVAKLGDQAGVRSTLAPFGIPEGARAGMAVLLPLAELAVAVALLITPSARWGAIAGVGLLAVFSGAVAIAIARGRQPDCACFGRLSSGPAGARTLARNALLAVPAAVVAGYGAGTGIGAWLQARSPAELEATAASIAAVGLAGLCLRLRQEVGRLRDALAGAHDEGAEVPPPLPVGSPAPGFTLPDLAGRMITLDALLARGRPVALVFVSADCGPCATLFPDLSRWQAALTDRVTIAPVAVAGASDGRRLADEHALENVLFEEDGEVFGAYRATATPSVVIVGADGRVASRTTPTVFMVESLIRRALHSAAATAPRGDAAPVDRPRLVVEHFGRPVGAR